MKISDETIRKIKQICTEDHVFLNESMKKHTSMEVGGPADCFITVQYENEIHELISFLINEEIRYYILGNGSNVICRDEGYQGVIVCLCPLFSGYEILEENENEVIVSVKAGTLNKDFALEMIKEGLTGFEFASGIPGSIGGATAMNAGAYDGEIKEITQKVRLLDSQGNIVTRLCEEMDFGYRHSLVSDGEYVVLETFFRMKKDDPVAIKARVDELTARRQEKQPLEYPSCGSTFKRPEGFFAGKLISDAGLKGMRLGGAQVSEKHAGFIINRSNATAADVLNLIELVKEKVFDTSQVMLECEVKIL